MPKFVKNTDVSAWLDEMAKEHRVLAPQQQGDAVVFAPLAKGGTPLLDRQATMPPKGAVFPASDTLLKYTYTKDLENLGQVDVDLHENVHPQSTVVFGGRPCDARGFTIFDRVYDSVNNPDVYYRARRQATIFVTQACAQTDPTCFCTAVGSGPADSTGSDVLMTAVEGGWFLEAVTPKGEKLLTAKTLADGADKAAEAETVQKQALENQPEQPDFDGCREALMDRFDDLAFWEDMSAKCISCGACTYMCPTCYCFNITDEQYGMKGVRIRSWDNCMSYQFTEEASGHNPRPTKAHRWRNRAGHKFSYYPGIHDGLIACCGCGRCIKQCPTCVDIRQIVTAAKAPKTAETA